MLQLCCPMGENAERTHSGLREEAAYKLIEIIGLAEVFLLLAQVLII